MSGIHQMMMAAGGGALVSQFGGNITKTVTSASACSVTVSFDSDGAVTGSEGGPAGSFSNGAAGDQWFDPVTPGIGAVNECRATLQSGSTPSSGSMVVDGVTWNALTTGRNVTYSSGTGGAISSRSGTVLFEIRPVGGSVQASGSFFFEAVRET